MHEMFLEQCRNSGKDISHTLLQYLCNTVTYTDDIVYINCSTLIEHSFLHSSKSSNRTLVECSRTMWNNLDSAYV